MSLPITYRLGSYEVTSELVLGTTFYERLHSKFPNLNTEEFNLAVRETIRFLFLAAQADTTLFLTGNKLIDEIWHEFVLETEWYQDFCEKVRPGVFIEHAGIPYSDYCKLKTPLELYEEQLSWLASYVNFFGKIETESVPYIPLVESMMSTMQINLDELNALAEKLIQETHATQKNKLFDFNKTLENVRVSASRLDSDVVLLKDFIFEIVSGFNHDDANLSYMPDNDALAEIFSCSTALGFTIWQHLGAMERLLAAEEWQKNNKKIWSEIKNCKKLVGLATTHLASAQGPLLKGDRVEGGFLVRGTAPWCTGYSIFSYFITSFKLENEIVTASIKFPEPFDAPSEYLSVQKTKLVAMNATSTIFMSFSGFYVADAQVVSRRFLTEQFRAPMSQYKMPDLGLAKGLLKKLNSYEGKSIRYPYIKEQLPPITKKLEELDKIRKDRDIAVTDQIDFEKTELIRKLVRLLVLCEGGKAITSDSDVSRLVLESLLWDVIVQNPSLIELKVKNTCQIG